MVLESPPPGRVRLGAPDPAPRVAVERSDAQEQGRQRRLFVYLQLEQRVGCRVEPHALRRGRRKANSVQVQRRGSRPAGVYRRVVPGV